MFDMANGGFKDCRDRKKLNMGREFEMSLISGFNSLELRDEIFYDSKGKIDFTWSRWLTELEAKRFVKTKWVNKAWLWRYVVKRFSPTAKHRFLIASKKVWGMEEDSYLESEGVKVIITGGIDSMEEKKMAVDVFIDKIVDFVIELKSLGEIGGQD
jgi:hypothetical protein